MVKRESICVVKVGGSILTDAKSYVEAARNIGRLAESGYLPIVVVSAAKGVTDILLRVSRGSEEELGRVFNLYIEIAEKLGSQKVYRRVFEELIALERAARLARGGCSPALQDLILSFGERLSKILMVEALETVGVRTLELDARDVIVTDGIHGDATINYLATLSRLVKIANLITGTRAVPVVEGFIGAAKDGRTTTLGRGGSDYTATSVAALLGVNDVYLVTDVDGIMTADPSVVPEARIVKVLSYAEAREAAIYGAKRINPKTFEPLVKFYSSTVYVGSWKLFGTKIQRRVPGEHAGAKMVVHGTPHRGIPYVAVIGEGVCSVSFVKRIVDTLYENEVEAMELRAKRRRPSVVVFVRVGDEIKTLKLLHRRILEEV
uniref:Aspartate kinase n=1 Tax=Fervidicoccus fontis TaxID=683846 RepID=A0A7J3ZK64_9CREN